jgi:hypothetical protein
MFKGGDVNGFSSPELKAQVSFYDRPLSVVRLTSVCWTFTCFSRTTGPILTKIGINHPLVNGIQNCSYESQAFFSKEEIITKE